MVRVTRLPVDPGTSGWEAILPARRHGPELDTSITADWIIVGAGFAGLAAARRLSQARPEDQIVILEAKTVGSGPAGRNSGFMIDLPHDLSSEDYGGAVDADRAQTADNRAAIDFAADMAADFGLGSEAFSRSGKINAAATEKGHRHNLEYAAHLKAMGEGHTLLDAAEMQALTGTSYYVSGLKTDGTAMIQPALYMRGLAQGLVSNRVRLFENTPVLGLSKSGTWSAETPKGKVRAPRVILAVNGHVQSFGAYQSRLVHVHTYASMTRALNAEEVARLGGESMWGLTPADPLGTTVRRISGTGGDRLIVRNRFTYDPSLEANPNAMDAIAKDHDAAFAARFPMLSNVEMAYRWGGRLCLSRNGAQAIAELEDGLFSACCQNGLGTVRGTLAGMLASDLAMDTSSDMLTRALGQTPNRLPPGPIATIGARARIKWGEWRAGREL